MPRPLERGSAGRGSSPAAPSPEVCLSDQDRQLVASFEDTTLPPSSLNHEAHVRLAWACLKESSLFSALNRLTEGLRRYTRRHGAEDKYHETITMAYSLAVYERLQKADAKEDWEAFADRYPELLEPGLGFVKRHYSSRVLESELARGSFVLPDLQS